MTHVNVSTMPVSLHGVQSPATEPTTTQASQNLAQNPSWRPTIILMLTGLQMILLILNVVWEIMLWQNLHKRHIFGFAVMLCFAALGIAIACVASPASRRPHNCISALRAMSILSAVCIPCAIVMYIVAIRFEGDNCTAEEEESDRFSLCIEEEDQMTSLDKTMYALLFACLSTAMIVTVVIIVCAGKIRDGAGTGLLTTQVIYTVPAQNVPYQPQFQTVGHTPAAAPTWQSHARVYSIGNPTPYTVTQGLRSLSGGNMA